jgi:hypothetical protein
MPTRVLGACAATFMSTVMLMYQCPRLSWLKLPDIPWGIEHAFPQVHWFIPDTADGECLAVKRHLIVERNPSKRFAATEPQPAFLMLLARSDILITDFLNRVTLYA